MPMQAQKTPHSRPVHRWTLISSQAPPPTFQASFLELQADLQLSLARIDAERTAAQGEASGAKQTDAKTSGTDRAKPAENRVADKVATEDAAPIPQAAETAQSKTTEVLAQVG